MATTTVAQEILETLFSDDLNRYELVDGVLCAKPMVSVCHGLLLLWLGKLRSNRLE